MESISYKQAFYMALSEKNYGVAEALALQSNLTNLSQNKINSHQNRSRKPISSLISGHVPQKQKRTIFH